MNNNILCVSERIRSTGSRLGAPLLEESHQS
jgi:hypothetical protein